MSPLIIPIAFEWVILVTTLAPAILTGRFSSHPRLGLVLWFSALLSSALATAVALAVALTSVFATYVQLSQSEPGSRDWLVTLAVSFAPWLILAVSGVALALINQRLEPFITSAREVTPLLDASMRPWMSFEGHRVMTVDLPIMLAAVVGSKILISRAAVSSLDEQQIHAVLWHEVGHIRGRHNALKQLAGFIRVLSPWLTATKVMITEVDRLAEVDADRYAMRHVDANLLSATRSKFISA